MKRRQSIRLSDWGPAAAGLKGIRVDTQLNGSASLLAVLVKGLLDVLSRA